MRLTSVLITDPHPLRMKTSPVTLPAFPGDDAPPPTFNMDELIVSRYRSGQRQTRIALSLGISPDRVAQAIGRARK